MAAIILKRTIYTGFLALCLWMTLPAFAEPHQGLFREISREGKTGWILGAVHTGRPDYFPLRDAIEEAFAHSDVLLFEMDEQSPASDEQQRILQRLTLYPHPDRIQNHISAETRKRLTQALGDYSIPLQAVENQLPAFIALMLTTLQMQQAGYSAEFGIDGHLIQRARGTKTLRPIETFEEQIQLIANLPQTEKLLVDAMDDLHDNPDLWKSIEDTWHRGDLERLEQLVLIEPLQEDPSQQDLFNAMFFDRNPRMAKAFDTCIQSGRRCFMTVGAGHLPGKEGILKWLQDQGYTVQAR
ncbi:MAG: TraB/GumN family protein [Hahellaceae bacterium]|nr:TraB/GumN family protein [Hahellaceae bacterium]